METFVTLKFPDGEYSIDVPTFDYFVNSSWRNNTNAIYLSDDMGNFLRTFIPFELEEVETFFNYVKDLHVGTINRNYNINQRVKIIEIAHFLDFKLEHYRRICFEILSIDFKDSLFNYYYRDLNIIPGAYENITILSVNDITRFITMSVTQLFYLFKYAYSNLIIGELNRFNITAKDIFRYECGKIFTNDNNIFRKSMIKYYIYRVITAYTKYVEDVLSIKLNHGYKFDEMDVKAMKRFYTSNPILYAFHSKSNNWKSLESICENHIIEVGNPIIKYTSSYIRAIGHIICLQYDR